MIYTHAAAGLVCAAIASVIAWNVQGWRMGDEISDIKAAYAEAARASEASAREREQAAATTLSAIEKKASNEQKSLSDQLAAAHRELRNRPQRPSGGDLSKSPGNSLGCTGAGLFAEDASAALREAARADDVRLQLEACKARYDAAVKLTN